MPKTLADLAVGTTLEVNVLPDGQAKYGEYLTLRIVDQNHTGYPDNSTTIRFDKVVHFGAFDASEPANPATMNQYGDHNPAVANITQWANKRAGADWFVSMTASDRPPSTANTYGVPAYDAEPTLLSALPQDFEDALLETELKYKPYAGENLGTLVTYNAKLFSLSAIEIDAAQTAYASEGTVLEYYKTAANRAMQAIPYYTAHTGNVIHYLRSTPGSGGKLTLQGPSTYNNTYSPYGNAVGHALHFNLSNQQAVSDTVNERGNYTLVFRATPTPPDGIQVPASTYDDGTINISWGESTDPEGETVHYVLERSINGGYYIEITEQAWRTYTDTAQNGWKSVSYRVKAVTDESGVAGEYTTSSQITVIGVVLYEFRVAKYTDRPTAVRVDCAHNGTLSMQVCNNYDDAAPTWEDAQEGTERVFANQVQTAGWAVGARIRIQPTDNEEVYSGEPVVLVMGGAT